MSPWLALPPRSLSEALRDRERERLRDPNLGFRLDRRRNYYVSTYRVAASISPRFARAQENPK